MLTLSFIKSRVRHFKKSAEDKTPISVYMSAFPSVRPCVRSPVCQSVNPFFYQSVGPSLMLPSNERKERRAGKIEKKN